MLRPVEPPCLNAAHVGVENCLAFLVGKGGDGGRGVLADPRK
jgi:hypothetical protein